MTAGDVAFQRQLPYVREHSPFYRDKLAGIRGSAARPADLAVHDQGRDPRVAGRRAAAGAPPRGPARARPAHLLDERHHRRSVLHRGHRRRPRGVDRDRLALLRRDRHRGRPARRPHLQLGPVRRGRGARRLAADRRHGHPGRQRQHRAAGARRSSASAPRRSAARPPTRSTSPTGAASATSTRASSACACSRSPASRAAARTRPGTRSRTAFGATVREAMGIADVSPSLWGECEEQAGMHFCGDPYIHVELIDPETDEPLPFEDGAEGELVYTTLIREAMPVLRFRSRDRVVVNAEAVRVRARRAARALHRPRRRPADRARRQPVPDRGARGGRRVPPARRRPGADPPRPHRRAPGRARRACSSSWPRRAAPTTELAGAIGQAIRTRLVVTAAVELVPYGTLGRSEYKSKLVDFSRVGYAVTPNSDGSRSVPLMTSSGEPSGSSRPLRMPK